jgi:hypothetical protein
MQGGRPTATASAAAHLLAMGDGWRASYRVHPAADLFPELDGDELDELAQGIARNGLRHPLVFWRGQLLDGRNRAAAIFRLGRPPVEPHSDDAVALPDDADPIAYVWDANGRRRHLTGAQKQDVIAALLKLAPERSDRQVARDTGSSPTWVRKVRKRLRTGAQLAEAPKRVGADGRTRRVPTATLQPESKPEPPRCESCGRPMRLCPDCTDKPGLVDEDALAAFGDAEIERLRSKWGEAS